MRDVGAPVNVVPMRQVPSALGDAQGGKRFGQLKDAQIRELRSTNDMFLNNELYTCDEDQLEAYAEKFCEYDHDNSGDLDLMDLKLMMEKLGQAKTHLQLKKMLQQVDLNGDGVISYYEYLVMMLGKKSSILQTILKFEAWSKRNENKEKQSGPPPKRSLADLP